MWNFIVSQRRALIGAASGAVGFAAAMGWLPPEAQAHAEQIIQAMGAVVGGLIVHDAVERNGAMRERLATLEVVREQSQAVTEVAAKVAEVAAAPSSSEASRIASDARAAFKRLTGN